MKRGRPNVRKVIQSNLTTILGTSQTPMTTSSLTRFISKDQNRKFSWNTIQKYIDEMVQEQKLEAIILPHSKIEDKDGLTMYTLKK